MSLLIIQDCCEEIITIFRYLVCMTALSKDMQPNGCELPVLEPQAQVSGRGLLPRSLPELQSSESSLAAAAGSPVRSSELLGVIIH
jgi:hypothetical protein